MAAAKSNAVVISGATDALNSYTSVNGVFDPTGELSGGRPLFRKRGDSDKWIHYWPALKLWIVTDTASKGKDASGWATIASEGSLESCAGRPWRMCVKGSQSYSEQPGVLLHVESLSHGLSSVSSLSTALPSAISSLSPVPHTACSSTPSPSSAPPSQPHPSTVSPHDHSHHLLHTEYRGVISIVASYVPPHSCLHAMLHDLKAVLPEVVRMDFIARECVTKAESVLQRLPPTVTRLSLDMAVAVAAYTYDLGISSATADSSDNLFVALNNMLRERDNSKLLKSRDFLFYLMKGLEQLPAANETVYRGIPGAHMAMVRSRYLVGSDVHWSAFNSTSTSIDKAKRFAQGPGGVIFRMRILNGRRVTAYSFFPDEAEILLSPNARFIVSSEVNLEADGYYYVDLVEKRGEGVVF